jgi:nitrogen regulatory protein P-II 1
MMKKIEAIIRPSRLEEIKEALNGIDILGLTISQVMGCGRQKGITEVYRGTQVEINVLPKIKIETVVDDDSVEKVISAIVAAARIGEVGDGKIFVYDIQDVVRIRTGERGTIAL